ncbi:glycoprotein Xg isoform X3 [Hippopotamus amphibius kiboko]|uniref:glycoprotein Xg isoform X3 n=1 Tax=Hippopotamus amphibius kiboko TaxID=575201 RepID=UPI002599682F|nr:glycoprotein Xg isoform X3 [Hippopotamus amphibius kiboko]XP_057573295.1 glycoprotein Xg isoform X3 [Hippopotamus amphibius kiboko]XP_057573296.1 glycoprotein Xg isoform X3 [Hippopotamus amphibius kiboko]
MRWMTLSPPKSQAQVSTQSRGPPTNHSLEILTTVEISTHGRSRPLRARSRTHSLGATTTVEEAAAAAAAAAPTPVMMATETRTEEAATDPAPTGVVTVKELFLRCCMRRCSLAKELTRAPAPPAARPVPPAWTLPHRPGL